MTSKKSRRRTNIRRRGDTYTYYLHVPDGRGGYRQVTRGGYATQREAELARAEALTAMQNGTYVKPERVTLGQFLLDEWLPSRLPPAIEESTYVQYRRNLTLHVVPHLGAIPLQQLSPVDLNRLYRQLLDGGRVGSYVPPRRYPAPFYDLAVAMRAEGRTYQDVAEALQEEFPDHADSITRHVVSAHCRRTRVRQDRTPPKATGKGLSPRTVRLIHAILHMALRDALRWNRVVRNVADAATPPSQASATPEKRRTWTADQLRGFLDLTAESRYLPAWLFIATSACRRGECLGLKWENIDLDGATAAIARQVIAVEGQMRIKELPKTKRPHAIVLDPTTVAVLRSWRARQNEEKLLAGAGYDDQGFVFCQPDGAPYHPERFSREFERKQALYNRTHPDDPLPPLGLHGNCSASWWPLSGLSGATAGESFETFA